MKFAQQPRSDMAETARIGLACVASDAPQQSLPAHRVATIIPVLFDAFLRGLLRHHLTAVAQLQLEPIREAATYPAGPTLARR
jgi:hypothetical protein